MEEEVSALRAEVQRLQQCLKAQVLAVDAGVSPSSGDKDDLLQPAAFNKLFGRVSVRTVLRAAAEESGGDSGRVFGRIVTVGGWVKTGREAGKGAFAFLEVSDGSCAQNLQCVVSAETHPLASLSKTGSSVVLKGELVKPPEGAKQIVELHAKEVVYAAAPGPSYPIAKTKLSLEFLRNSNVIHLRQRTNTLAAAARVRNLLCNAIHQFFQSRGFLYVNTPLITTSDCEGAGEMFQVTTLLGGIEEREKSPPPTEDEIKGVEEQLDELRQKLDDANNTANSEESSSTKKKAKGQAKKLQTQIETSALNLANLNAKARERGGLPRAEGGGVDYAEDFFGKAAFLTVSGQLAAEASACALSSVYTFGPTFRAENSHTTRHIAEFWMLEPELAFADINDTMDCAEALVQYCCQQLLSECLEDIEFFTAMFDKECKSRLQLVAETPFKRLTYTEAINILKDKVKSKQVKFEADVEWGVDLASEHERYLSEVVIGGPVIVYNYPKAFKAFYMRVNELEMDGDIARETVAALDILVPKVGELVGGSQREERMDVLEQRIIEMGLELGPYEWYLDLRRHGTVPHSGFGLGFERLIMFATGLENIRDTIPFPRYPGRADL